MPSKIEAIHFVLDISIFPLFSKIWYIRKRINGIVSGKKKRFTHQYSTIIVKQVSCESKYRMVAWLATIKHQIKNSNDN